MERIFGPDDPVAAATPVHSEGVAAAAAETPVVQRGAETPRLGDSPEAETLVGGEGDRSPPPRPPTPPPLPPPLDSPLLAAPVPAPPAPSQASQQPGPRRVIREGTQEWGSFRLTWIPPKPECKFGAWQGLCRYHKMDTVRCTRRLNVDAPDRIEFTKNLVKSWLLQAPRYHRKGTHDKWNPRDHPCQVVEVMDLQVWVLRPPPPAAELKSDEQLDAAEAEAEALEAEALEAREAAMPEREGPVDAREEERGGPGAADSSSGRGSSSSSSSRSSSSSSSD